MAACGSGSDDTLTPEQPEQPENPGDNDDSEAPSQPTDPTPGNNGRYLVLFASRSGNTERLANEIREQLDCDILEVEPEVPYDNDYNTMLERSQEELAAIRQGNYPPIKTSVETFDNYVYWLSDLVRQHGDTDADVPAFPCLETCRKTNRPVRYQWQQWYFHFGQRGPHPMPRCNDNRPELVADLFEPSTNGDTCSGIARRNRGEP